MAGHTRDGWTSNSDPGGSAPWPANRSRPPTLQPTADGGWRPEAGAGFVIGGALIAAAVVIALFALREAAYSSGPLTVVWLLLASAAGVGVVFVAGLLLRLRSLRYVLGPDALIVQRRGLRIVVPYEAIDDVVLRPRDRIELAGYERYWPGYYDALVATSEGPWRSLATTPPNRRVRIHSGNNPVLAISPERPVLFVEALETRRRLAAERRLGFMPPAESPSWEELRDIPVPTPPVDRQPERRVTGEARRERLPGLPRAELPAWLASPAAWRVFRERIVRGDVVSSNLLALSLIVLIVLITLTAWRADATNSPVAVRWDASGQPVQWVRPDGFWIFAGVWIFPLTAAAVIVINAALATFAVICERLREARMLLATALPVELVLIAALWRATR